MVQHDRSEQNAVLQIFAREPLPGQVNTRLIPHIGAEQAAALQDELIRQRLDTFTASADYQVQLWCTPDRNAGYFQQCRQRYSIELCQQTGTDLGQRMANAIRCGLNDNDFVIMVGTDAPALDIEHIHSTLQALQQGSDVVIVPAEDGGYVLIAMNAYYPEVFDAVNWGSSEVCAQTVSNIERLNLKYTLLEPCWDIDRIEDYHRYMRLISDC